MINERMTLKEMEEEASLWNPLGTGSAEDFVDAPEFVPRATQSTPINIRLPIIMISILKELARREGIGYQVLIKRWLDDRIRREHKKLKEQMERSKTLFKLDSPTFFSQAASFNPSTVKEVSRTISTV